jgi:hypothetical protein
MLTGTLALVNGLCCRQVCVDFRRRLTDVLGLHISLPRPVRSFADQSCTLNHCFSRDRMELHQFKILTIIPSVATIALFAVSVALSCILLVHVDTLCPTWKSTHVMSRTVVIQCKKGDGFSCHLSICATHLASMTIRGIQ